MLAEAQRITRIQPVYRHYHRLIFSCASLFTRHTATSSGDGEKPPVPGSDESKTSENQITASERQVKAKRDPEKHTVILFPGQGAQFPGMGASLLGYPNVSQLYERAGELLGFDLLQTCLHGSPDELNRTSVCQPATFVTSLAALQKLRCERPEAVENCIETAGFSVGEYAALVFAGVLDFESALSLVKVRAEAMQVCAEQSASAMLTVRTTAASKLGRLCVEARRRLEATGALPYNKAVCAVAVNLMPHCKVLGGHEPCVRFAQEHGTRYGVRPLRAVNVAGAFHTQLMKQAEQPFREFANTIKFGSPRIMVRANVDGKPYPRSARNQRAFRDRLVKQLTQPVRWESILHRAFDKSLYWTGERKPAKPHMYPHSYEMGPGKQLGTLIRSWNKHISARCVSIPV